uniref:Uncharacterized protein n=1 Tax=Arundo donax TaxID=35708 RepID=A0A0A8YWL7_ARUDO
MQLFCVNRSTVMLLQCLELSLFMQIG